MFCAFHPSAEQKQSVATQPVHDAETAAHGGQQHAQRAGAGERGPGPTGRPAGRHRRDVLVWVELKTRA